MRVIHTEQSGTRLNHQFPSYIKFHQPQGAVKGFSSGRDVLGDEMTGAGSRSEPSSHVFWFDVVPSCVAHLPPPSLPIVSTHRLYPPSLPMALIAREISGLDPRIGALTSNSTVNGMTAILALLAMVFGECDVIFRRRLNADGIWAGNLISTTLVEIACAETGNISDGDMTLDNEIAV